MTVRQAELSHSRRAHRGEVGGARKTRAAVLDAVPSDWPDIAKRIAERLPGMAASTVEKHLRALARDGEIRRIRGHGGKHRAIALYWKDA